MSHFEETKYKYLKKVANGVTTNYVKCIKAKWQNPPLDPTIPFYIEDNSGQNSTLTVNTSYTDATNIEYSTDNVTWSSTNPGVPANGKVYIRADATKWGGIPARFDSNHSFNVGGNALSLFYGSSFTGNETLFPTASASQYENEAMSRMFYYDTNLISAENLLLPKDVPYVRCYQEMFKGCTSLTSAPTLPATTLTQGCYWSMFIGCTSLTKAPTLPATTLVQDCYREMFRNCTNLNSITVGATSWDTSYASNWVDGIAATGTFTKPTNTNISTSANGIPSGWTVVNV